MVGSFESFSSVISISSLIFLIFLSSTTASAEELLSPLEDAEEVYVGRPHYIPVIFTGPFTRRSIALTHHHEEQQPPSFLNEDERRENGYVVQKLFSSNSNDLQSRNNAAAAAAASTPPLYKFRKANKIWAPHNLRVEHHQSMGNALKQILMRMNYQR